METPFVFGKMAIGDDFTNRQDEIVHLSQNFISGINTILISPRRWGKSSLVAKAATETLNRHKEMRIVFIDLFNVRSEEDFYRNLAESVIKATTNKMQEVISQSKKFFKQLIPKISFSPDHIHKFSLAFDWQQVKKQPAEILNLAESIAESKRIKIVVCIDEFQNTGFFTDSLAFQKTLRSHWQQHQFASYCLFGSKRHMLMEVFALPSMPFYKFGDLIFLDKISIENWEPFIISRFKETGKSLTASQSRTIANFAECHPYYVQQLAQVCWLRCEKKLTEEVISQAVESLILQLSLLFQNIMETLSLTQINFLHALLKEEPHLSSMAAIQKYQLGTSANVSQVKQALTGKEIIDSVSGKIVILDPIFKLWLGRYYFDRE